MAIIFKPDWSINVANIAVVVMAVMGGIGAWYDVKSDTRMNTRDIAALQVVSERHKQEDVANDLRQDAKREAVVVDLKSALKDNRDDIKSDIRDLRNDLFRKK
jgi:hypothetical protein